MGGFLPTESVKRLVTVWLLNFPWGGLSRLDLSLLSFFSFNSHDHGVECLHIVLDCVVHACVSERARDHNEQVIDDHLGEVKDLGVLLIRSQQVPVKLGGKVG